MATSAYTGENQNKMTTLGKENFEDHWVYYERLATDFYGKYYPLYNSIKQHIKSLPDVDYIQAGYSVLQMAQAERKKENEALRKAFGDSLGAIRPEDLSIKELVECFNILLSTSKLYQRNLTLIQESQGQKTTPTFFDFYIEKAFNAPDMQQLIEKKILQHPACAIDLSVAAKEVLDELMPKIISNGLGLMANAKVESGIKTNREEVANAYKELLSGLNRLKTSNNPYIREIANLYNLDAVFDEYSKKLRITKAGKLDKRLTKLTKKAIVKTTSAQAQLGGGMREIMEQMTANLNSGTTKNYKGMNLKINASLNASRIGDLGAATDVLATINIPTEEMAKISNEAVIDKSKVNRIDKFIELSERLQRYENSLIIHISSKNYSLNSDFAKRGGYSTTEMTPTSLQHTLSAANIEVENLISLIIQLCKGAIGETAGIQKDIENDIAQYFAYIFFDDVQTIGEKMRKDNSGISIHVLDLNGVEVPLSVFLEYLGQSIFEETTRQAVQVDILAPKILYPKRNQTASQEKWIKQRNDALKNTKITTHFLSKIRDFFNF